METEQAKDVLATALRALDRVGYTALRGWRAKLAHHLGRRTTILCGADAALFTDGEGGG